MRVACICTNFYYNIRLYAIYLHASNSMRVFYFTVSLRVIRMSKYNISKKKEKKKWFIFNCMNLVKGNGFSSRNGNKRRASRWDLIYFAWILTTGRVAAKVRWKCFNESKRDYFYVRLLYNNKCKLHIL